MAKNKHFLWLLLGVPFLFNYVSVTRLKAKKETSTLTTVSHTTAEQNLKEFRLNEVYFIADMPSAENDKSSANRILKATASSITMLKRDNKLSQQISQLQAELKKLSLQLDQALFKEKTWVQLILLEVYPINKLDAVTLELKKIRQQMHIKRNQIKVLRSCKQELRQLENKPIVKAVLACECSL